VLCPSLFEILSAAREELDATVTDLSLSAGGGPPPQVDGGAEGAVPLQLQETVSRCLGILFDLFPDAVLEYLLGTGGGGRTPRAVLASIVCLQHMDLRLRVRLLKILAGVANVRLPLFSLSSPFPSFSAAHSGLTSSPPPPPFPLQMAGALGAVPRVRELLLSEPLNSALQSCYRFRGKTGDAEVQLFNRISRQLLDQAAEM
jgi:hypothetical protein